MRIQSAYKRDIASIIGGDLKWIATGMYLQWMQCVKTRLYYQRQR